MRQLHGAQSPSELFFVAPSPIVVSTGSPGEGVPGRSGLNIQLRSNVRRAGGTLQVVRQAKGSKTRELPLHRSVTEALGAYLARRTTDEKGSLSEAFFISPAGSRLLYCNVHWTFQRLVATAKIEPRSTACRPRIHDLRHGFAVRALLDAYREGLDASRRLSLLSTYLGHVDPAGTYWYLSATPELLGLAAARLEEREAQR